MKYCEQVIEWTMESTVPLYCTKRLRKPTTINGLTLKLCVKHKKQLLRKLKGGDYYDNTTSKQNTSTLRKD